MLDLSFGLSIPVRDAALKMIAPGPAGEVNKQYYAQEHEREIEEGRGAVEAYGNTDEKARDLLRKLARSEPYRRRDADHGDEKLLTAGGGGGGGGGHMPGPVRTRDSRGGRGGRGGARGGRAFPSTAQLPPGPQDILPPADPNIASLFITGIEDDLPEHEIRTFFAQYGTLRSVVCSHRSHCGYINYQTRNGAEAAAEACQGKATIAGCPLRVRWGKPRKLDSMDNEERIQNLRDGRSVNAVPRNSRNTHAGASTGGSAQEVEDLDSLIGQAPPGTEEVNYASLAGN
jgi:pre-mRNA-splicing factor RBM22/SLT11